MPATRPRRRPAEQACRPHDRLAIRGQQVGLADRLAQRLVVLELDDLGRVDRDVVVRRSLANELVDARARGLQIDGMDRHARDAHGLEAVWSPAHAHPPCGATAIGVLREDREVEPDRPRLRIAEVELDPLVEVGDGATPADLPQTGDAGDHREALDLASACSARPRRGSAAVGRRGSCRP